MKKLISHQEFIISTPTNPRCSRIINIVKELNSEITTVNYLQYNEHSVLVTASTYYYGALIISH